MLLKSDLHNKPVNLKNYFQSISILELNFGDSLHGLQKMRKLLLFTFWSIYLHENKFMDLNNFLNARDDVSKHTD